MMSRRTVAMLTLAPVAVFFASLFVGRFVIAPVDVARILWAQFFPSEHAWPASVETIVMQIRLPRSILAMFIGAEKQMVILGFTLKPSNWFSIATLMHARDADVGVQPEGGGRAI